MNAVCLPCLACHLNFSCRLLVGRCVFLCSRIFIGEGVSSRNSFCACVKIISVFSLNLWLVILWVLLFKKSYCFWSYYQNKFVIFFPAYIKDAQIINWLHEFRSSVAYLTKDFEQLVSILLVTTHLLHGEVKSLVLKTSVWHLGLYLLSETAMVEKKPRGSGRISGLSWQSGVSTNCPS